MSKLHIKKGDTVYVNSGEDKGQTGRVLKVLVKEGRALEMCIRDRGKRQVNYKEAITKTVELREVYKKQSGGDVYKRQTLYSLWSFMSDRNS